VNPYLADSLALVDPATGQITDMTASCGFPHGPLAPTGIVCEHSTSTSSSLTALGWDGHETVLASQIPTPPGSAVLSPDGTRAATLVEVQSSPSWKFDLELAQNGTLSSLHISAEPVGWFDSTHLLINTNSTPEIAPTFEIVDVTDGSVISVDLAGNHGFVSTGAYFATFPSD
jgi:hypothetical protein